MSRREFMGLLGGVANRCPRAAADNADDRVSLGSYGSGREADQIRARHQFS
jgi:hypothetical protein